MEEDEDETVSQERVVMATMGERKVRETSSLEERESRLKLLTSADSVDTAVSLTGMTSTRYTERTFKKSTFSRSGTSSSSQESEPAVTTNASSGQFLAASRVETARSMESLRPSKDHSSPSRPASSCTAVHKTAHRSFLTASERDVRESRGAPARRALSGEDVGSANATAAERRRGFFASSERRAIQQLSLPPPERRLTILSPHSPMATPHELHWPLSSTGAGIRTRRKKGMVLPKLILPRSDSDQSEVFFDRCIIE